MSSKESQVSLPEPPVVVDSLWDLFIQGLSQSPESPALVCMHQPPTHLSKLIGLSSLSTVSSTLDCLTWTYKTLHTAILHTASGLKARGIQSNTILVTLLPSGVEWVIAYWVAALLRLTFVPLDEDVLTPGRASELDFHIQHLKASVVFVSNTTQSTVWRDSSSRLEISSGLIIIATGSGSGSLEDIASSLSPTEILQGPPDSSPDDPSRIAQILFTSGTSTGKPKGCPLTIENLVHGQATYIPSRQIDPSTRNVLHSANFCAGANGYVGCIASVGACQIIPKPNNSAATAILEAIESQQANYVWCMPAQLYAMTIDPSFPYRSLGTVRMMFISGDTVTSSILLRASHAFPSAKILTGYGMTEGVGNIGWLSIPASIPAFGEILALGKVLPGCKIKICDKEGAVPLGSIGELHICSRKVIRRYFNGVHSEMFYEDTEGRWMVTGDRAMMNEDGFVFIVGRSKDIIMRCGIPIPPSVIESCLNKDGVEAQVIGHPSPLYGENPTAILNSLCGNTVQELKNQVVERLGKSYEIGDIFTLEELGLQGWPLNPSGKVMKHVLKEVVAKYLEKGD